MEENKNITPEIQNDADSVNETELKTEKKNKKANKPKREKLIKNQALLRKGGFSMAITAAVLAGIIIFNVLVSALADRFVLEFDMSAEKINSFSEENIEYLKKLNDEVEIIVCATDTDYVSYMSYYAQNMYGISTDPTEYFSQTLKLLDKYPQYNDKITLRYVNTQANEFSEITSKYSNESLSYGDVIVVNKNSENERYKLLGFDDIYNVTEDATYSAYGITQATLDGNNLETAVTSAIAYVTNSETKKVAFITGHSKNDYTETYRALLKANNYEITDIDDTLVTSISNDFDLIVISAPNTDFLGSELDAMSAFLENDGKLDKGLIFFPDATAPYLTNLYDFLEQWGVAIQEGVLFETNQSNYMPEDPMTMGSYPAEEDITSGMQLCITGYNVPMSPAFENEGTIKTTVLMETPDSVVAAPQGTAANWTGADDYTKTSYATALMAEMSDYDDDNNAISSFVMAFSSVEFIYSEYNEQASVANKNLTLALSEIAVGAEDTGISFISKTITNESFADSVTASKANVMRIIFMVMLPIISIIAGIVIFIRRKNA